MRPSGDALLASDLLQERCNGFRFAVCQPVAALSPARRTLLFRVRGLPVCCWALEEIPRPSIVLVPHACTVSSDNKNSVSSDAFRGKSDRAPWVQGPPSLMVDFCVMVSLFAASARAGLLSHHETAPLPQTPTPHGARR